MPLNKKNLHAVVEHFLAAGEDRPAVEQGQRRYSYRQLGLMANRLAAQLQGAGLQTQQIVGLAMPASIEYLVAMLASVKSAAIFLPLDLATPPLRQAQLFGVVSPSLLLYRPQDESAARQMAEQCAGGVTLLAVDLAALLQQPASTADQSPPLRAGDDDTGYLIQTSGSTGVPKLIAGRNKGISHFVHWEVAELGLNAHTRASWLAAPTFDVSLRETFAVLLAGGTLVVPEPADRADSHTLVEWLDARQVTLLHCVPSLFRLITRSVRDLQRPPSQLQVIALAGEPLYGADVTHWREAAGAQGWLINLYGPSETTLAKIFHRVDGEEYAAGAIVPLGQPINNTAILILSNGRLCDIGETGEIHIRTPFASNGYYHDPAATDAAFIVNPLDENGSDRIYKTGDLGRYRSDRSIEFVGRADRQVKIDGVRIDLPEIEGVMRNWPGIGEAVAHAFRLADGSNSLVVYFTLAGNVPPGEAAARHSDAMRAHLAQQLPAGMLPGHVVCLDDFPRNLNGKIDRRALPRPEALQLGDKGFVAAQGDIETALATLWAEALALDRVSVESPFLHIGGNSLRAIGLLGRINRQFGAALTLRDFFENGTIRALAQRLQNQEATSAPPIEPAPQQADYPLTDAQNRLWVLSQLDGNEALYHNPEWLELHGELDIAALRAAFQLLADRHESLRTVFEIHHGEARQRVLPQMPVAWQEIAFDPSHDDQTLADSLAQEIERLNHQPFHLEHGPLWRVTLLRQRADCHHLLVNMHHLICDGWSMAMLNRELAIAYRAARQGHTPDLPPTALQMRDVAHWLSRQTAGAGALAAHRDYWRSRLVDLDQRAMLPTRPLNDDAPLAAGSVTLELPASRAKVLQQWLASREISPFMGVAAALAVLLQRYGGSDTVIFGTPIEGRSHPQLAQVVGFFVNTLPLALKLPANLSITDLLERSRRAVTEMHAHQDYPFEKLAAEYGNVRDPLRNPLFEVMLAMEPAADDFVLDDIKVHPHPLPSSQARYDLTLRLAVGEAGWQLHFDYRQSLYPREFVEGLGRHLVNLLVGLMQYHKGTIADLPMLTVEEEQTLTWMGRGPLRDIPAGSLPGLFSAQAARTPDAPALRSDDACLNYATLDRASNQLAQDLIAEHGVQPGQVIAVLLERSLEWPIALLATLKAGAIYLPLDPRQPDQRLLELIADAAAPLLLSSPALLARLREAGLPATVTGVNARIVDGGCDTAPYPHLDPEAAAYLIYTSGSTGKPKGVLVPHRAFINMIDDQINALDVTPQDRILQFVSPAFDVSLFEVFLALLSGATLVLAKRDETATAPGFSAVLQRHGVSIAAVTPGFLNTVIDLPLAPLRMIITGGEAPKWPDVVAVRQRGIRYINAYGPSETAVCAAFHEVSDFDTAAPLPLGRSTANCRLMVVAPDLSPVPLGVPGELMIEGAAVGLGYLGQSGLTEAAFSQSGSGVRRYRTGDRVIRQANGALHFLGRVDGQVKVRGYRIETGEIETALRRQPGVADARVITRKLGEDLALACYWLANDQAPTDDDAASRQMMQALARQLPDYMVPRLFCRLAQFPLNSNGKLDITALPEPRRLMTAQDNSPPQGPVETALAQLWAEILDLPTVSRHADFFDLGGRSLAASRLVLRASRSLQRPVSLRDLYTASTPAALAARLAGQAELPATPLPSLSDEDRAPLAPMQQRLWVLDGIGQSSAAYHISGLTAIWGELDLVALRAALRDLVERHDVLRSRIVLVDGQPQQQVDPVADVEFVAISGELLDDTERRERLIAFRDRPFRLAEQWPLRVMWCHTGPQRGLLLTVVHHIAADGWSMPLLSRDLASAYTARLQQQAPDWPAPTARYREVAHWWRQALDSGDFDQDRDYWHQQLAGPLPTLNLHTDYPRPAVQGLRGATLRLPLPVASRRALQQLAQQAQCSEFTAALAVLQALLWRLSGQQDLIIGAPVAGRIHPAAESLVGCFVNTLPLRGQLDPSQPFSDWLLQTKQTVRDGLLHQAYPFDRLVSELALERDTARSPLFDVMLSVEPLAGATPLPGLVTEAAELPRLGSRCDLCWMLNIGQDAALNPGHLDLEYDSDLFSEATAHQLGQRLFQLLEAAAATPERPLATLDWLGQRERHWLLHELNPVSPPLPEGTVLAQFEHWVARTPAAPALISDRLQLSYREVDLAAQGWAQQILLELAGVSPIGRTIALQFERGPQWVVAVLAIQKLGAVYLPIEADAPAERCHFLLEDSEAVLLLHDQPRPCQHGLVIPQLRLGEFRHAVGSVASQPRRADDPIYLMYTSGSTGRPKGVVASQQGVLRLVNDCRYFAPRSGDRILQLSNYAFDGATFDLYAALCHGLALCLPDRDTALDPLALGAFVERHGVTLTFITTALFNQWVQADMPSLARLRKVYFGGQEANLPQVEKALAAMQRNDALVHVYGPTEATTFSTFHLIHPADLSGRHPRLPIGLPIGHTTAHVLDKHGQPQPAGVPGELYLGGPGLALGYLGLPDATIERFVSLQLDPLLPPERLYRTGDLCVRRNDGAILFLGRLDGQVKVRGYRVELGEVEQCLLAFAGIEHVHVMPRQTALGNTELLAYYTVAGGLTVDEQRLHSWLAERLPAYMRPAHCVVLDRLPLNRNGKVDRAALPAPSRPAPTALAHQQAANTPQEQALWQCWSAVLGRQDFGVDDNYYSLGGDSIQAIQISVKLRELGYQLKVTQLMQTPTIAALAPLLQASQRESQALTAETGDAPLLPVQHWFVAQGFCHANHFNQSVLLQCPAGQAVATLQAALDTLVDHHDALRLRFGHADSGFWSRFEPPGQPAALAVVDGNLATMADDIQRRQRSLQPATAPLFQAVLYRLDDASCRLFLTAHHWAIDGVSWRILLSDLAALLQGQPLPARSHSPAAWARRLSGDSRFLAQQAYWQQRQSWQAGRLPDLREPAKPAPVSARLQLAFSLDVAATEALLGDCHHAYQTQGDELLLAAWLHTLAEVQGSPICRITLEGHGREALYDDIDLSRSVGWFTAMYPLTVHFNGEGWSMRIRETKEALRAVPDRGLGYGVLRYLRHDAVLDQGALAQTSFNYLGRFDDRSPMPLAPESTGDEISPDTRLPHALDLTAEVKAGQLQLRLVGDSGRYPDGLFVRLRQQLERNLHALIAHCRDCDSPQLSPSDVDFEGMDIAALDAFLDDLGQEKL
ncbi:non-ribosomal peptide synthetase [Parachitinimonas caeni]|uniref:Amino acid adenylation domain-containing protein n=1 Tax=Parachitinimonas caeni TaxID=3031301 RepID=A0ABT7E1E0_9NEIS|nr:non-ribosomal peptide synthetase [Parachitinimonas caeni]MDK2126142.1 amino acid adenylation domain-containing protein [Parachitinimonas caeni]